MSRYKCLKSYRGYCLLSILLTTLTFFSFQTKLNAQDISDLMRYSHDNSLGSGARYRALSGAFGALGGDFSALSDNPASSAVFTNHKGGLSLNVANTNNDVSYFGISNSRGKSGFNVNQAGAVLIFNNPKSDAFVDRISVGVNYDVNSNYYRDHIARGNSPNSIDRYFLYYADGKPLGNIQLREGEDLSDLFSSLPYGEQQAFLGYTSYLINPTDNDDLNNTTYTSNVYSSNGVNQNYRLSEKGWAGKTAFNFGMRLKKRIYVGANLNYHFLNYTQSKFITETGHDSNSTIGDITFENDLNTVGEGFSYQLGFIAKLIKGLRLGASYQSPVYYSNVEDKLDQKISVYREDNKEVNPVAPLYGTLFDYRLRLPATLSGSMAYVFGEKGLISFQYTYKDYATSDIISLGSHVDFNRESILTGVSSFRLGGEYNHKKLSFRLGVRQEGSPYKNENNGFNGYYIGDLLGYSFGLGYKFTNLSVDLTYDGYSVDGKYQLYNISDLPNFYSYQRHGNNISLSFRFNF